MDPHREHSRISSQVIDPPISNQGAEQYRTRELKDGRWSDRQQQQVISMLSSLQSNFSSLLHVISSRLKYDRTKEAAFDLLYQEMEDLKQDQEIAQLRPLYIDLILLIDRMNSIYNSKIDSGCKSPELVDTLQTLSHEVLEILYRRGVELIVSTSKVFDPKIQQVVEVVPADNSEENNLIVEVIRHGFKYKDVVLRPEEVAIKKVPVTT